ncbi:hypothetical protein NP590_18370 [Methylomonas sp. SURF-2]|uniref:DUF6701 domain-containing protein n=1 Tax=Methylomonas subterranea TaxID=2952225 RepID=A0ABT1TLI8_9GAMM|nr:DUF6701 domain-containing protein [Methylomonas sp. SURF-2]MCQ8106081.1 hypothetical protein [Methylomonas sp. SURF-2]
MTFSRYIGLGRFFFCLTVTWLSISLNPAWAVNYIFPGNLPAGCSGGNGTYTCSSLSLNYADTISIAAPAPASITVNNNLSLPSAVKINDGGSAANLSLVVTGNLSVVYATIVNANVTAKSVSDSNGSNTFGGSLHATEGNIKLAFKTSVAGSVGSAGGNITFDQNNEIGGGVSSVSGSIKLGYQSKVSGETSSSGSIELGQESVASACVRSTASASIKLGYRAKVDGVCCGSGCGTSCVVNNSTYAMPAACSAPPSPSLAYFPVPVSPLNEDITKWSNGSVYAGKFNGSQTLGGIPFELQTDADGDNVFWGTNLNISNFSGSSSLTLTLATNLFGATTVYTLINSAWGNAGSNVGSITFKASNGDTHTVQLVEGVNVRDHYYGSFVNTVSSSAVTLNVIGTNQSGTAHLDMQAFALPSAFQNETLTSIVFTSTGSSSTGLPFLAGVTVRAQSLGGSGSIVAPKSFNCVEPGADALAGHLYTKLSATPFAFNVVALKDSDNDGVADAVATTYASDVNRSVTVELVDAAGGGSCSALPALSPAVSQTLTFGKAAQASELGRKNSAAMTVSKAYPKLRCRVTDASQSSPVVGCSTDSFAVRPSAFNVTSSADGSGTVKAGAGFTLSAASGVVGYNGTPKLDAGKLIAHAGAVAKGLLAGNFGAADANSGTATGSAFTYSEVGHFSLSALGVYDDSFAAVDVATGDCTADFSNTASPAGLYGCKFGNTVTSSSFGRFIPDHFDVGLNTPVFAAACASFTYVGQAIKYATRPLATVSAKNASGEITKNYTGNYWKIDPSHAAHGIFPSYSEAGRPLTVLNALPPLATDNGNGTGTLSFADTVSDILALTRIDPIAPFNAEIALSFALRDSDGVSASGNPLRFGAASPGNGMAFSGGNKEMRWGRLRLQNANGSELLPLPLPLFSEYFNGAGFVKNSADNCTALQLASQLSLSNPATADGAARAGNAAMTLAPAGVSQAALSHPSLLAGEAGLSFSAPGSGNTGYIDIAGNFAALPWLLFDWDHDGSHDDSPTARASFGIYKGNGRQIYRREVY